MKLKAKIAGIFAVAAFALTAVSADAAFTRDLTLGSTGADVIELQTWLEAKGFLMIPAGTSKGYFGTLTQSALARWQASVGISPAAGYFGPITRAKIAADTTTGSNNGGTTTNNGGSSSNNNSSLSGGEANLTDFDLKREDSEGAEGEEEVEVATASFDVEDGDVRIERVELTASSSPSNGSTRPWDYFDRVIVMADGKEIGDMDVDSRADWDEDRKNEYTLTITGLNYVVEEDDKAEITFAFDIADNIDSDDLDQTFQFYVKDDGIRATDGEGIQQYIGDDSDTVSFGFGEEENGDLTIKSNSDDPTTSILVSDEDEESQEYTVFIFDLDNQEDVDALITDLRITASSTTDADDVIRKATLVVDGDEFDGDINADDITFDDIDVEVGGDSRVAFELMITLVRNAPNTTISFGVNAAGIDAEGLESGDEADVTGSRTSKTHTVASTGVNVAPVSTSMKIVTPGNSASSTYGEYVIRFNVSALEDDAFIATTASSSASAAVGVIYSIDGAFTGTTPSATVRARGGDYRMQNGYILIEEDDEAELELVVTLDPSTAGQYGVELEAIKFASTSTTTAQSTYTVDQDEADFKTGVQYIAN